MKKFDMAGFAFLPLNGSYCARFVRQSSGAFDPHDFQNAKDQVLKTLTRSSLALSDSWTQNAAFRGPRISSHPSTAFFSGHLGHLCHLLSSLDLLPVGGIPLNPQSVSSVVNRFGPFVPCGGIHSVHTCLSLFVAMHFPARAQNRCQKGQKCHGGFLSEMRKEKVKQW